MAAIQAFAGSGAMAPDNAPVVSGGGAFTPGGINIGSKVVGSGSAATTLPPQAFPADNGSVYQASSNAVSGAPAWVVPSIIGAVILALLFIFKPGRK